MRYGLGPEKCIFFGFRVRGLRECHVAWEVSLKTLFSNPACPHTTRMRLAETEDSSPLLHLALRNLEEQDVFTKYMWSLVFSAQTLCTVGYGHVHAVSEPEIAFVVPFLMICSMIFSVYIANMQMNTRSRFDPDALATQSRNQVNLAGPCHQVKIS